MTVTLEAIDAESGAVSPFVITERGSRTAAAAHPGEMVFRRLLANTLVTGVTNSFVWFAVTFWVYLETRSVVATGVIGGAFSLSFAFLGPAFGTYVDRHRKHAAMMLATTASCI